MAVENNELATIYIYRCNWFIRHNKKDTAKKWFDKAWEARKKYGCSEETDWAIEILRENWYPTAASIIRESREHISYDYNRYGDYEGAILARQEYD